MPRPSRRRIADGECDFRPGPEVLCGGMDQLAEGAHLRPHDPVGPPPPPMTTARRRRWCRDLAIVAGHEIGGLSANELARTFGLSRAATQDIIRNMAGRARPDGATPDAGAEAQGRPVDRDRP